MCGAEQSSLERFEPTRGGIYRNPGACLYFSLYNVVYGLLESSFVLT